MGTDEPPVLIIGAGVAGLSLAIRLAQRNIACRVLEARQRFDDPTSGVRVSGEGVKILRSLQLDAIGEETRTVEMRFGGLSARFSTPASDFAAIIVTRQALHEQLVKRAGLLGIPLESGFRVAGVAETARGVVVTSDAGETLSGALVVGADGVGSRVRQILNPDQVSTKTYAGYLGVGFITGDATKAEMTVHRYPGHQVGSASCGKVNEAATGRSIFVWTHIRMPEAEAQQATRARVEAELTRRAAQWKPALKRWFDSYSRDASAILAFGPVYNGRPPVVWFSDRMCLIGDAAHPYGPGGQGISMALKDAEALSEVIAGGFGAEAKRDFQRSRAAEARKLGEAAERRNAKDASATRLGTLVEGLAMKAVEIVTRGKLKI